MGNLLREHGNMGVVLLTFAYIHNQTSYRSVIYVYTL
jgi:hypothetical protein